MSKSDMNYRAMGGALACVSGERVRQHGTWGLQRHTWPEWVAILGEEYGEVCQAVVHMHWPPQDTNRELLDELRTEMIQLAAVAVAVIEHIDEVIDGS